MLWHTGDEMKSGIKKTLRYSGIALCSLLGIMIFNQLIDLYTAFENINSTFALILTLVIGLFLMTIFLIPIIGFIKLNKPLDIPDRDDTERYSRYLLKVKKRLERNKHLILEKFVFDDLKSPADEIQRAYVILDQKAETVIKDAASTVFLTTAISQNGVLDGLFVMINLSRMVWQVSHIYNQRPAVNEIGYLYINVVATVLMAREIEDIVLLDEQLEPVISSLIGGTLTTLVPGMTAVANLIVNSVIEGSANAFLTLRVGMMARKYASTIISPDRRSIRRSSILEACGLLGSVVQNNSVSIAKSIMNASKRATIDKSADMLKSGAKRTTDVFKEFFNTKMKPSDSD